MKDIAADAAYLMGNEAFKQALESARQQAFDAALRCPINDDDGRRRYLDAVRTVDKVKAHIAALVVLPAEETNVTDFYEAKSKSILANWLKR